MLYGFDVVTNQRQNALFFDLKHGSPARVILYNLH
jgi:hypothetical protein